MNEITIKDWINLPETQLMERRYKDDGVLDEKSSWGDFEIVPSIKAYETYKNTGTGFHESYVNKTHNITYGICYAADNADEWLMRFITNVLFSLRIAAVSTKVEGFPVGSGKLIIQDRMPITIRGDDTSSVLRRCLFWRGTMFRINDTYELR